jgi:hypothetical protein
MTIPKDLGPIFREIEELTALCLALRRGYLRTHPDAPRTARELEYEAIAREHGLDPEVMAYGGRITPGTERAPS